MRNWAVTAFLIIVCVLPGWSQKKVKLPSQNSLRGFLANTQTSEASPDFFLEWTAPKTHTSFDNRQITQVYFENARLKGKNNQPYFGSTLECASTTDKVEIRLSNIEFEPVPEKEQRYLSDADIASEFLAAGVVRKSAGKKLALVTVDPIRKIGSKYERLTGFDVEMIERKGFASRGSRSNSWKATSVLNSSTWYRIATYEEAIYKVTYSYLNQIGFNMSGVTSDQIRLYGSGAGTLSPENQDERPDDLEEFSIWMEDGNDGTFDQGDYFLFYGEDQVTWKPNGDHWEHDLNPYSDSVFYFITVGGAVGLPKRITEKSFSGAASQNVSVYDYYDLHEEDESNLIKSGRNWVGEQLGVIPSIDFGFNVPDIDVSSEVRIESKVVGRSVNRAGTIIKMILPNQGGISESFSVTEVGSFYGAPHAIEGTLVVKTAPSSGNLLTKIEFDRSANSQAQAWVDYVEVNAKRRLSFIPPLMGFRATSALGQNLVQYNLSSSEGVSVWDISDQTDIYQSDLSGGVVNGFSFTAPGDVLREFICFNLDEVKTPRKSGWVENQNLHGLSNIEYVIVTAPEFKSQAERLALYHEQADNLSYALVTPQEIYNEFSGGAQDITAIKEFMRMLYHRADSSGGTKPKYLLLFGDASYDYKDRVSGNSNYVPTYQTQNSLTPTRSIASDDYYGLMDDLEGQASTDLIDFGIGRLPVRHRTEAEAVVDKILYYATNRTTLGEWRNWISFVADDADPGDGHTFMIDCDGLAELIDDAASEYNVSKVYMDGFKQETGSGGERYPEGADEITNQIEEGRLMMYYIGHGGELGWSHERILDVATINKWENIDNLPLLVTATCEFSRFDDPRRTSAGEYAMLNPSGGAIALLSTTRAVYASPNLTLSTQFTVAAFDRSSGEWPRLGDIMLVTKVNTVDTNESAAPNSRSFALLGDPALRLDYPEYQIEITSMPDTMKALEKVRVEGQVVDQAGNIFESFDGVVYPTVFDKISDLQSLNNDGVGIYEYQQRQSRVFKGKSSVTNGKFFFEFVVPKDINRNFDIGKVSMYAHNGEIDANGADANYQIGGLSDNPIVDELGPQIDLFMNNNKFVFGGLTNENPDLYAELWDENGINMVGTGIGHDITAVLDNATARTIILNNYYEANIDSYQGGKVVYPFNDLDEGRHSLKLQVWDVNNNPSDAYIEFVVANDEELALEHVLNYPNPFTTNTDFYFEHNKPGQNLSVRVEVFSVSGKLIKTIDGRFTSDGFRVGPINWNGRDDFGDQLARGVYLYRLAVSTQIGETAEIFERLVLLK